MGSWTEEEEGFYGGCIAKRNKWLETGTEGGGEKPREERSDALLVAGLRHYFYPILTHVVVFCCVSLELGILVHVCEAFIDYFGL